MADLSPEARSDEGNGAAEHGPDAWHQDPAALAEGWTVPCEHCGRPVTEANSCAEMVARDGGDWEDGTGRVVARRAWCDRDPCFEDMMSGFGKAAP